MYRSLYKILNPLVKLRSKGILRVWHEYGSDAEIFLSDGLIQGIRVGEKSGKNATNALIGWVSISDEFSEGETPRPGHGPGIDTDGLLTMLAKVEKRVGMIKKLVPENDAVFRLKPTEMMGEMKFSPQKLKVVIAISGKRSVKEIVLKSGLSELWALSIISQLCQQGLALMVSAQKPMEDKEKAHFLNSLKETLLELVGPAADVIIDDAFESIGSEPELVSRNQIAELIEAISYHLNSDEQLFFKKWGIDYIKKIQTKAQET